jgi:hypothetical protein
MAREAGFDVMRLRGVLPHVPEAILIANVCVTKEVNRLVALARADERDRAMRENAYVQAERDACAKLAEQTPKMTAYGERMAVQDYIAAAIRARGNT